MRKRLQTAGLALLILIAGMGAIVAVTEYEAGANAVGPPMLTTADVVNALVESGVTIDASRLPAHHPLLSVSGTTLTATTGQIEVYVYPDVASRVADEQRIQRQLVQLQVFASDGESIERVTSARNILLLFDAASQPELAAIHAAARALVFGDES